MPICRRERMVRIVDSLVGIQIERSVFNDTLRNKKSVDWIGKGVGIDREEGNRRSYKDDRHSDDLL